MMAQNRLRSRMILGIYLLATFALLFLGYSVQKPKVPRQEFPFTIAYSYQGNTETISDVYVAEYVPGAKYIGDDSVNWYGYIKDHDRLQWDYYRIGEVDGQVFSINLNLEPGYLMGDPKYAHSAGQPTGAYHGSDGTNDIEVTDPAQLATLGLSIVSWEYPDPIENSFTFGGISLSSEATLYTSAIAVVTLLTCMILIKKDSELAYVMLDKFSIITNILVATVAFPFIFIASALSEIVADASIGQQLLYLSPALTVLGVAASISLRRMGQQYAGFGIQFAGPAIFALMLLLVAP